MKMEKYESFDDFEASQTKSNQQLISKIRELVNSTAPELTETVKWGNGCWLNKELPAIFIHCEDDYVQLGFFFGGSKINDPDNVLRGSAKFVRHIPIKNCRRY